MIMEKMIMKKIMEKIMEKNEYKLRPVNTSWSLYENDFFEGR
jgi:hypothetical protein